MQDVRLLLDEDVWPGLAEALRNRGFDAISVHELDRTGLPDWQQLEFAVREERAILTHNVGDFVSLARAYHVEGRGHLGIIIAPHLTKGALIRRTLTLLESLARAELENTVRYV